MVRRRSKLQEVIAEKGIDTARLAGGAQLSIRSIHNVSCGSSKSRAARERIQQFLQTQIWDDVPLVQRVRFGLDAGDFVVLPTEEAAEEFARELGGAAEQLGRHVRILGKLELTCANSPDLDNSTPPSLSGVTDSGSEGAIEFWSGATPPDSPFAPNDLLISGAAAPKARTHTTRKTASKVAAATRAPEKPGARKGESE